MAVTYTNVTDGQNVAVWATNINAFGNAVKANIDSIESDITAVEANVTNLLDVGISVTKATGAVVAQTMGLAYTKITMFDVFDINTLGSQIAVASDGTITFTAGGIYKIRFSGSFEGDNTEVITFNYNLNGSHMITNPPQFVGLGATKPVSINNGVVVNITSGDVLYIEAKSDTASTSVNPLGCMMSIEKTSY